MLALFVRSEKEYAESRFSEHIIIKLTAVVFFPVDVAVAGVVVVVKRSVTNSAPTLDCFAFETCRRQCIAFNSHLLLGIRRTSICGYCSLFLPVFIRYTFIDEESSTLYLADLGVTLLHYSSVCEFVQFKLFSTYSK